LRFILCIATSGHIISIAAEHIKYFIKLPIFFALSDANTICNTFYLVNKIKGTIKLPPPTQKPGHYNKLRYPPSKFINHKVNLESKVKYKTI